MLPDRSVFIGQKLVENAKIKAFKCDILSNFQTMCLCGLYCFSCEELQTLETGFHFLHLKETFCTIVNVVTTKCTLSPPAHWIILSRGLEGKGE